MEYIIGKFDSKSAIDQAETILKDKGFKKFSSTSGEHDAIRIIGANFYSKGVYTNYLKYHKSGMKVYSNAKIITWNEFYKNNFENPLVEKPSLEERKLAHQLTLQNVLKNTVAKKLEELNEENYIKIEKSKLVPTYNKVSPELKQFMKLLFGEELFVEKTYKVGDKFSRGKDDQYVIAKVNSNVVTILNCTTFENFGLSKQVTDINNITVSELKSLLGVWYEEFKLV